MQRQEIAKIQDVGEEGDSEEGKDRDSSEDLLAREKAKPEDTKDEARINRISGELERESVVGKSKSTLIVEFSIENAQVVRKQSIQQKSSRESVCP